MKKTPLRKISKRTKKNAAWRYFSKYIRLRDCLKTTGTLEYGKCFTCGKLVSLNMSDAGHFISRRFNATLFDETNVHLQCRFCNRFLNGNLLEYRRQLVKMYGEGYDIQLEDKATDIVKFTPQDYQDIASKYK